MIRMVSPSSVWETASSRERFDDSERDPSGLVDRMIGVGTRDGKRISQHAARLLEGYLVLPGVRSSLVRIPGYPHRPILRCRCLLPLLAFNAGTCHRMPASISRCVHLHVDGSRARAWRFSPHSPASGIGSTSPGLLHPVAGPPKAERNRQLSARATPRRGLSYSEGGREGAPGVPGALIERGVGRLVAGQ